MRPVTQETEKGKRPKLLRIVIICLAALFLLYNLYLWNAKTIRGNALPMPLGVGAAVVLSGSMEPTFSVDDVILVVASKEYQVDDIVVYQSGDSLVVHRIVQIDGEMVITKGDANNVADEPIALSQIKGRVVTHVDRVGAMVRMIKSPMICFGLLGLAILLLERTFRRDKQEKQDEVEQMKAEIQRLKAQQEAAQE